MPIKRLSWGAKTIAVLVKDIRGELRTRYAIGAIVMFAVITVVAVGFSLSGIPLDLNLQGILFWLVIYFASVAGLGQSFIKEEESKTSLALRIYAPPVAVFGGKLLFNLLLLFTLEIVLVPLFALLVGLGIRQLPLFIAILATGTFGLACSTTIVAAIIAKASIKGVLFAVLSFPLILPVLIMAIKGTQKALSIGLVFASASGELQVLISYAAIMLIAGFLLFEFVWND
ncbi:MAG: ABC transporter permease [candidate division Zixibacteria bacterium]|jgi:heme exporter protein B|nr:ABC transporter permease [candidate division Zixibacteria bacterium]